MAALTPEQWLYLTGGAALLALGLVIAALRGRSAVVLAFAAYAIGTGALGLATFIDAPYTRATVWWPALALGALGFWGLFLLFPRPIPTRHAVPASLAAAAGLAMGLLYQFGAAVPLRANGSALVAGVDLSLQSLVSGGIIAVTLLLPLRTAWPGVDRTEARSFGIVAVGLVAATAGAFSDIGRVARGDGPALTGMLHAAYVLIPIFLWLRVTRGAHPRVARNVIVAATAIHLGSILLGPDAAWALGQATGALLLAYAVLRGQIEGLDLKVRFALSRSTVAATFVAVFFIAGEGAQILFGQGNQWVGLLSAGALVFALAPLQRAAERLAEKAVPLTATAARSVGGDEDAYRHAVRWAMRGGSLTPDEERALAVVATRLGLTPERAWEVRREAERAGPEAREEVMPR